MSCHSQLCSRSLSEAESSGGITSDIFAHAVIPLFALSRSAHEKEQIDHVLNTLAQLRRYSAVKATADASPAAADFSSAAARCAVDPLCIIFSMLSVKEFLLAQRCCRSWHAVRLNPPSWPNERH